MALSKWISEKFIAWLTLERPYEGLPLCDFERILYEARPGDVLLIEGRSRVSDIIRSITNSSWSHSILYLGQLHDIEDPKLRNIVSTYVQAPADAHLIIEGIMGKGATVNLLSYYKNDHIRLCRPKGLSRKDAQNVIAYAIRCLGKSYDARQILDLARFLLPWTIMPRHFRSQLFEFQAEESTKTVCSTMIAEAFASVDFPILPLIQQNAENGIELIARNPKLYTPRDFDYSPYFEILKFPFVEFSDNALYRKLPWNRQGLVSHDEFGVKPVIINNSQELTNPPKAKKKSVLNTLKAQFTSREHFFTDDKKNEEEPINRPESLEKGPNKPPNPPL